MRCDFCKFTVRQPDRNDEDHMRIVKIIMDHCEREHGRSLHDDYPEIEKMLIRGTIGSH